MNPFKLLLHILQILGLSMAFVLTGSEVEAADTKSYVVVGTGRNSCGKWSGDKKSDPTAYLADVNWVGGFISAFNLYAWKGKGVSSETDGAGMFAWIDNYCAANPTETIAAASGALVNFLAPGTHLNDK